MTMEYQAMTRSRWLQLVADNAGKLRQLVADYHPSKRGSNPLPIGQITAPHAEMACEDVRQAIRVQELGDPLVRWDKALSDGDIFTLNTLLSDTWFGVPESTACWSIPGFAIACDLLDDPPDE